MSRPVIGITTYREPARFGAWDLPAAVLPQNYVDRVDEAGAQPVLLPPNGSPAELLSRLDGVIVSGGGDVDPGRYGESPHSSVGYVRPFRDDAELALTAAAITADLPFLGICRGQQILNVVRGGRLHQHVPDVVGHTRHAPAPGRYGWEPVRVAADSRLAGIVGDDVNVAHSHHQSVDVPGDGLIPVAWADDDVIEAIELPTARFTIAVQWHPEVDADRGLFAALVDAARAPGV